MSLVCTSQPLHSNLECLAFYSNFQKAMDKQSEKYSTCMLKFYCKGGRGREREGEEGRGREREREGEGEGGRGREGGVSYLHPCTR